MERAPPLPQSGAGVALSAAALAARLPPLLVAAERIAATLAAGAHGRRRGGPGDSFWQYRPYAPGDPPARIAWRQAARAGAPAPRGWFVRQTEWEAAATIALWVDASPSMAWRSEPSLPEKRERGVLLALALAATLLRAEERVALPGTADPRPASGRAALGRLASGLLGAAAWPEAAALPRRARLVLIGDFLGPVPPVEALLAAAAGRAMGGAMVQILDPAEETLPYSGRLRFEGLEGETPILAPRVEALRDRYAARLAERRAALTALGRRFGFTFLRHRTDQPPAAALLALYLTLAGR